MADNSYDVIVVGARCAGSPTAMLLARKGYRVLLVDRATFPSDTLSTHVVHPPGIAALDRWGLLGQLTATGCPPITTYRFDFGAFVLAGSPGTAESPVAYCPRRIVLDKLLVDAAEDAGAEVREGFTVSEILASDDRVIGIRGHSKGGGSVSERARAVVGADGLHSLLAQSVEPEQYLEKPPLLCGYYTYWSGLPANGRFENYLRHERGWAACPTHDGLTMVVVGWPAAQFAANKTDIEGNYLRSFEQAPEFAERIHSATREARFAGTTVPNYFRKPYGSGWVLVGDAGYNKDFITAQGISDAFRDAELAADALDASLSGAMPYDAAMAGYQSTRDEHVRGTYEFTTQLATLEPPPPPMQQVLAAMVGNQPAMDGFARVSAGATSPGEFFAPDNVANILATTS